MKFLFLFIFITIFQFAYCQLNNFKPYSIENGLSQSTVYSMIQDSRGYIWLGTDGGGVCRFDGRSFKIYNKKTGLSGNVVRSMYEDKSGRIWFGTDHGITVYDGFILKLINQPDELNQGTILCFYEDENSNIWAGSDNGLFKIAKKDSTYEIQRFSTAEGLVTNFIFDIYIDNNQIMWLAMYGGIQYSDLKTDEYKFDEYIYNSSLPGNIITCIQPVENKILFGSYDNGMFAINLSGEDSGKVQLFEYSEELNTGTIWDILEDSKKNIWICTDKSGVFKIKGKNVSHFSETEGLKNNQILCVLEDYENNIWFGSMGSGLIRHLGDFFSHFTATSGLKYEQISGIRQDDKGNFWISSLGGGLIKMKNKENSYEFNSYTIKDGLSDNNINSLFIDDENNIWLATQNGISVFDGKKFYIINEDNGLVDNRVNCIYKDKNEIIWIGTGAGLSIYSNNEFLNITQESQYEIQNDKIQTIIGDKSGNKWVGTLGGLIKFNEGQMTQYNDADGLLDISIHALAEDVKGNIWIGTYGGGLYKFDQNTSDSIKIILIAGDEKLSSANIYSLVFFDSNTLIVGTDNGFDKIILDKDQNIISVRSYHRSDGFFGVENKLNAIFKDNEKNIWFGTVKGLTKYSPEIEKINLQAPKVYLTGIDLFFEEVDWKQMADSVIPWFNVPNELILPYSKNHISFKFNAISLSNPDKIKYKYKLTGLDSDWSPERDENEAVYSGLAPGTYSFEIIAANENNIWSEKPLVYTFTIKPPFWQTTWFIALVIIFIVVSIYVFIRLRERKLKLEKAVLEQKVRERTHEIFEKNKMLETANEEIIQQKDMIEEKNKDIMDSIRYAKRIQEALLPPGEFISQFLKNSFVLFKPKDIVSGDFYWMHPVNDNVLFAAVDCTGHGVPGAFMSIVGHNGLNQAVIEHKQTSPSEILNRLNLIVSGTLSQKKGDSAIRDGMDLALCCLNYQNLELQFSGAKNPLYIIRDNNLIEYKADKQPIGYIEDGVIQPFSNELIELKSGDLLYIFSDGYPDQFGGAFGKKYKYKNFKETLISISHLDMESQKQKLDEIIEKWRGDIEQVDDILIIGVNI
ncbi:MAG: two-component regulator propeller domain-containing protein [Bacteroidota bacterium]